MVLAAAGWFTRQLLFDGFVDGLVYGLLAMGIVLVFRATRVINFAVGNLGLVGAALFALMVVQYRFPFWLALGLALLIGTAFAAAVELAVIRRLFDAPRVIVLVATIGIAQLALAVVTAFPDIEDRRARFPLAVGSEREVAQVRVTGSQLAVLVAVPVVAVGLSWILNRTTLGKTVKAAASNPDLSRVSGINPKIVSTGVWALAGLVATVSMILIAGDDGSVTDFVTLGPNTLVRALAAAVIAGMTSFRRALLAGVVLGVVQALLAFNFLDQVGLIDFLVFLAVLVAVFFQSREGEPDRSVFSFTPRIAPVPEHLRRLWWVRNLDRLFLVVAGVAAVALPLVVTAPSRHLLYTTVLAFALCATSLTVLTGWAGQLSLGQMAFAGIGALTAAALTRGLALHWGDTTLIEIYAMPFALSIVVAGLVTAALAVAIGAGALRVRGLLLAVTTFAFGLAAQQYLYRRPVFVGDGGSTVAFPRGDLLGLDLASQRSYYYVVLAVLAVALGVLARLRRGGVGRTTIAVRDNADTAAAYTVPAAATKLRAFAIAGALAGIGGALLAGTVLAVPYTERFFRVEDSLALVAIVVIGGLGSLSGAILGAIWVVGLPAFFPEQELVPLVTSSVGLLVLLLYFPGGLAQIGYSSRRALLAWVEQRVPAPPVKSATARPSLHRTHAREAPRAETAADPLVTTDVRVRFGGIAAVDGASIAVHDGEVVGLIGTNGAGKSTLMNAIGGFVPSTGRVELLGRDVSRASAAKRASAGLGRTFQAATLFPELTVRDVVLVALEARGRSRLLSSALALPAARRRERTARAEAAELIDFLGLGRYADRYVADLSTGTRRIVELAGLLALDARLLCLDEPTAGVAQRETEAFGQVIGEIRAELGASVLLIEHDMPLIMGISDRVYCMEAGRVIAEGPPAAVREDPAVIASYLGTDERAIARSGAAAPSSSPVHDLST